jgi:hypothetical protein
MLVPSCEKVLSCSMFPDSKITYTGIFQATAHIWKASPKLRIYFVIRFRFKIYLSNFVVAERFTPGEFAVFVSLGITRKCCL